MLDLFDDPIDVESVVQGLPHAAITSCPFEAIGHEDDGQSAVRFVSQSRSILRDPIPTLNADASCDIGSTVQQGVHPLF